MRFVLVLCVATALSSSVLAQTEQEHAAHHPAGASAPSSGVKAPSKAPPKAIAPTQIGVQIKSMREMHDKMMAAKTPEERAALMKDHMKAMQDGMAMLGQMKGAKGRMGMGGGMVMSPEMIGQRMDMMEMMMQMMMDREAARPSATR